MAVTIDDLKDHARILSTDEHPDSVLTRKLAVASEMIAQKVGGFDRFGDNVPAPLDEAVLMFAAHLLQHREATTYGAQAYAMPLGVEDLIAPWRTVWTF